MKLKNIIRNCFCTTIIIGAAATMSLNSCTEKIDDSSLYTFTGEMMTDHFVNHPDTFSYYLTLLQKVHPNKASESTMAQLLSARGHYTCFAPTNEAIQNYLDSLVGINLVKSNNIADITDSVATAIVFNSIIQNGDLAAYMTTDFTEGPLPSTNMNDRYISVRYVTDTLNNTYTYINLNSLIVDGDIEVENGYIHAINKVLSPSNSSVADVVVTTENTSLFGQLLELTGWSKKLQDVEDEAWKEYWQENGGENQKPGDTYDSGVFQGKYPESRKIGYTIFAETNDVFEKYGINADNLITELKTILQAQAYYDDDAAETLGMQTSWGEDYTNDNNWLNQFVAYHLLPEALPYRHLVSYANEYGYSAADLKTRTENQFKVNVFEYWETMGVHRRTMKVTGCRVDGVIQCRINRKSLYNKRYQELRDEITKPGIRIYPKNGDYNNDDIINGFYYPIDDILIWKQETPNEILNERMRYDVTSLFPEFLTNRIRQYGGNGSEKGTRANNWFIHPDYCDNIKNMTSSTKFCYLVNKNYEGAKNAWMNYQIDEFNIHGIFDFTMKLPPVPYSGTYEIRYGINSDWKRGMAQVYIGTNPNNLPAIGIPLDLRNTSGTTTTATGWKSDTDLGDDDAINENDKSMRNLGFMKGPKYIQLANSLTGRDCEYCLRKIIYTGQLNAGETYWIRFKSVLEGTSYEFFYDYLEMVPKSVYAGLEAEDKW